jgi:hypothetical protein
VAEYGQRGWAVCYSNGMLKSSLAGAGLPANLVHSNTGLVGHARHLIVQHEEAGIGEGRDVGDMHGFVTTLAMVIVTGAWDDGQKTHPADASWTLRPLVLLMVKVLGGAMCTDPYAPSANSIRAGKAGDPANLEHITKAVRRLETLMVDIHHKGGLVPVNAMGNFGLEQLVEHAAGGVNVERTLQVLGRALSRIHHDMDDLRTRLVTTSSAVKGRFFEGGGSPATAIPLDPRSPLDLISIVAAVRREGLPRYTDSQLREEGVVHQLSHLGLTPEMITQLVASQKRTRWGPTITIPPEAVEVVKRQRSHPGSPAPQPVTASPAVTPSSSRAASPAALPPPPPPSRDLHGDLAAVSAMERLAGPSVCPWWSLFGHCDGAAKDECTRCPTGKMATQSQVDAVFQRMSSEPRRGFKGLPCDNKGQPMLNPNPGTGLKRKARPEAGSPAKVKPAPEPG